MFGNPLISPLIQLGFQNEVVVGKEKQEKRETVKAVPTLFPFDRFDHFQVGL